MPAPRTQSAILRAALMMGQACGSLEDIPPELADMVAHQCLRTVLLRDRLTRGNRLRLCWSADPREARAIAELARLEAGLEGAPRLIGLLRAARHAGRPDLARHWTEVSLGFLGYDGPDEAGTPVEPDHRERRAGTAASRRGFYQELRAALGDRKIVPLPD